MRGGAATAAVNGAVEALVRTLAVELAPVRVNAVSPGIVDTPTCAGLPDDQRRAMFDRLAGALPAGRVGAPDDVADAVWHLLTNGREPSSTSRAATGSRRRESTGRTASVTLRQAVHACHAVTPVPAVLGRMRAPDPQGPRLVVGWIRAFFDEALADAPHVEDAEPTFDRRANDPEGAWLVWDDRGPVSLAGVGNRTVHRPGKPHLERDLRANRPRARRPP
jgi:hypothetical protein